MLMTIIVGLIVGVVAKFFMPGKDPGGIIITIILGIGGAAVAGFIGRAVGWYVPGSGPGLIASVLGAMLILLIYRKMFAKA
jgi:uncharacterized membrane protein YeaQ/YmgE (transglycosylase-associated protein family)